jgi:hypothetical protein
MNMHLSIPRKRTPSILHQRDMVAWEAAISSGLKDLMIAGKIGRKLKILVKTSIPH